MSTLVCFSGASVVLAALTPAELDRALFHAATLGDADQARALIDAGASPNPRVATDPSPLDAAAWTGHCEIVDLLLALGADVNYQVGTQPTALHRAAGAGHVDCIDSLFAAGANVEARADVRRTDGQVEDLVVTLSGFTPLIWAAREGHLDAVRALLAHGADINARVPRARINDDRTAIWFAAYNDHVEVVRYLAEHGTDAGAIHQVLRTFGTRPERRALWRMLRKARKHAPERSEAKAPPPSAN